MAKVIKGIIQDSIDHFRDDDKKQGRSDKVAGMLINKSTLVKDMRKQIDILQTALPKATTKAQKEIIQNKINKLDSRINRYIATFKREEIAHQTEISDWFANFADHGDKLKQYKEAIKNRHEGVSLAIIDELFNSQHSKKDMYEQRDPIQGFIDFVEGRSIIRPATIGKAIVLVGAAALISAGALAAFPALATAVGGELLAGLIVGGGAALLASPVVFKKEIKKAWGLFVENHKSNRIEKDTALQKEADQETNSFTTGRALNEFQDAHGGLEDDKKTPKNMTADEKTAYNEFVNAYKEVIEAIKYQDESILGTGADKAASYSDAFKKRISVIEADANFKALPANKREELRTLFAELKEFINELDNKTKTMTSVRDRKTIIKDMQLNAGLLKNDGQERLENL